MTIVPNLHFSGRCAQAIELYQRAFDARVAVLLRYADAQDERYSGERADFVYHAELFIGPVRLMMSDASELDAPAGNTVSILLSMESVKQAEASFAILSEGGRVITAPCTTSYSDYFTSLIDCIGVRWELIVEK